MKDGQTPSRVYLNERLYEKKVETVARAKSAGACYMLVPAGRAKVFFFFFRKNWSSWEGYSTVEGGGEGFVTLLAEPSFCMSCNRLAMFCKEMYERVASPG